MEGLSDVKIRYSRLFLYKFIAMDMISIPYKKRVR